MQLLTLEQQADYLVNASQIEQTIDAGFAVIHIGRSDLGAPFVMVNDFKGQTVITEAL